MAIIVTDQIAEKKADIKVELVEEEEVISVHVSERRRYKHVTPSQPMYTALRPGVNFEQGIIKAVKK